MAGLVLALFLLAAVQEHVSCVSRTKVNEVRLNDLTEKLASIKDKVGESILEKKRKELTELDGRIDELEGSGCGDRQWRCGSLVKQCILDLLVCDGSADCTDGSDEVHCKNPASSGKSFTGKLYNENCLASDIPEKLTIDVIGQRDNIWFSTVSELKVHITAVRRDGSVKENDYNAVYYFGQRLLVVYPHKGDHITITCRFRSETSDYCHAKLGSINTYETCAKAILGPEEE